MCLVDCCSPSATRPAGGDGERQGLSVNVQEPEVTVIPDRPRDSQASDSDSDGPILYRDEEEEDEEDDEYTTSMGWIFRCSQCYFCVKYSVV